MARKTSYLVYVGEGPPRRVETIQQARGLATDSDDDPTTVAQSQNIESKHTYNA